MAVGTVGKFQVYKKFLFVNLLFLWLEFTFSLAQRKSNKKKHGADVARRVG